MQENFNFFLEKHHFFVFSTLFCLFFGVFGTFFAHFTSFVRLTGLEPARRGTLDPKSSASTNSATGASFVTFSGVFLSKRLQR